jgi:conjugative transfer region protein (TIGR03748 family)
MVPSHRSPPCRFVALAHVWSAVGVLSLLACGMAAAQSAPDIRLSRYTTTSATPEAAQLDPLEAVVQLSLPRTNVQTVGDAITYLLLRTGYRLAPQETVDPPTRAVLAMPLPEVHRRLGPYTVRTALSVLLGRPFVLSVDPMQRLVSYAVDVPTGPGAAAMAGVSRTTTATERPGSTR